MNGAPNSQWPNTIPISVNGIGVKDHERKLETAKLRYDQNVDRHNRDHESRTHIAERHIGYFPFTIPQERRLGLVLRLTVQKNGRLQQLSPIMRLDQVIDRQHTVDGCLVLSGEFRSDEVGVVSVAAKDHRRTDFFGHAYNVAQFDDSLVAGLGICGNRRRCEFLRPRQIAFRQTDDYFDGIAVFTAVRITDRERRRAARSACHTHRFVRRRNIPACPDRW